MEVYNTKGVIMYPLAVVFGIMLILLNGYCCGASVLVESNTTFRCDGRLDECLLEDDLQLEFLMNPYVSRLLDTDPLVGDPNDKSSPVFHACGGKPTDKKMIPDYDTCVSKFKNNLHGCKKQNTYMKCSTNPTNP